MGLCSGEEDLLDFLNDCTNDDLGLGEGDRPAKKEDEITEAPKKGIER